MGEPNTGGGVLPPVGEGQQSRNPVLGRPSGDDDIDLDKLHNQYVIDQLNKLVNDIFEYHQLDDKHKLHHLIDHEYVNNDDDTASSGDNDDSWADNIDNVTGGNPYNH